MFSENGFEQFYVIGPTQPKVFIIVFRRDDPYEGTI